MKELMYIVQRTINCNSVTYRELFLELLLHVLLSRMLPILSHVLSIELVSKREADKNWHLLLLQPLQPLLGRLSVHFPGREEMNLILHSKMCTDVSLLLLTTLPVVNHKDDNLCNGEEEVCEVRNAVVLIVHPRKVHHIQSLHMLIQVVHEWHCGTLGLRGSHCNLLYTSAWYQVNCAAS